MKGAPEYLVLDDDRIPFTASNLKIKDTNGNDVTIENAIRQCFQSVSDGKKLLATTLTNGGISTASNAEFSAINTSIVNYGDSKYNNGINYADSRENKSSTSYKSGYNAGTTSGYTSGYNLGTATGYTSGYNAGSSDGYNTGVTAADNRVNTESVNYKTGYNSGYSTGITTADNRVNTSSVNYKSGYNAGTSAGYSSGYSKGLTDGKNGRYLVTTNSITVNMTSTKQDVTVNSGLKNPVYFYASGTNGSGGVLRSMERVASDAYGSYTFRAEASVIGSYNITWLAVGHENASSIGGGSEF